MNVYSSNVASSNIIGAFGGTKGTEKLSLLRGDIARHSNGVARIEKNCNLPKLA